MKENVIPTLYCESVELSLKFAKVSRSLKFSLKGRKAHKDLIEFIVDEPGELQPIHDTHRTFHCEKSALRDCTSVDEVWKIISVYFSFFNYHLLEDMVDHLGTEQDKQNMISYKSDFMKYAERMVYECPAELGYQVEGDHTLHVKLDSTYDNSTLNQLAIFKKRLCDVLKVQRSSLILYRVERGCYELKFQTRTHIKDRIFPLSSDQQTELGNLGVVWIQCDEYEYHTELEKVCEHACSLLYLCIQHVIH